MKRIYQVTQVNADIVKMEVKIGTVGIGYTAVYQARSGGQKTLIAESDTQSAGIKKKTIGTSGTLRGSYIIIQTVITLGSALKSDWEAITKNIFGAYILYGGFMGDMVFNYDPDDVTVSANKKVIVITKPIEIT